MNLLGAVLIVVFGFLFVTVSSRLTGEIGSSSNPISGMTVATLLLTCLIFLVVGWTGGTTTSRRCRSAASSASPPRTAAPRRRTSRPAFWSAPRRSCQQIAILIGALASALVLGPILLGLNNAATVYVPAAQVAPGLHAPTPAKLEPARNR